MANDVEFRELASDETLPSVYDLVLTAAFTPDELEPLYKLRGYLEASPPEAFGLYAVDQRGDPIGCCIYCPIRTRARCCWGTWRSWLTGEVAVSGLGYSRKARANGSPMINTIS